MIVDGRPSYRTAVVKLSNRIQIDRIEARPLETAKTRELVASLPGTIAAAFVTPPSGESVIAVSMYAQWVRTHTRVGSSFLFSDGSAHHVVSDLSTFIAKEGGHRVVAAGDMNILRGYREYGKTPVGLRVRLGGTRRLADGASPQRARGMGSRATIAGSR